MVDEAATRRERMELVHKPQAVRGTPGAAMPEKLLGEETAEHAAERPTERGARFLTMIEPNRSQLRGFAAGLLKQDEQTGRTHKCDELIDGAVLKIANATVQLGRDFGPASKDTLMERIRFEITERLNDKPDRGYALGE